MKAADILSLSIGKTNGVVKDEGEEFFAAHIASLAGANELYDKQHFRDAYICLVNSVETYLKHVFLRCATTEVEDRKAKGLPVVLKQYDPKKKFSHNLALLGSELQRHIDEIRTGDFIHLQSLLPTTSPIANRDSFAENYVNLRYRDPSYQSGISGLTVKDFCRTRYEAILPLFRKVREEVLKDLGETL